MTNIGDIVFCQVAGQGDWVAREVSSVDPNGRITDVSPPGHPQTRIKMSLFSEHKIPDQKNKLLKPFVEECLDDAGRINET